MTIELTPLTVLIGENSSGKSTVLQAIDFLASMAFRDIPEYLREKDWDFSSLKSQFKGMNEKPIEFITEWNFLTYGKNELLKWEISVDITKNANDDQNPYSNLFEHLMWKHLNRSVEFKNTYQQMKKPPCIKNLNAWGMLSTT